ncbi:MAG: SDR family NAD(P)-dependent oxidoreductase [Verrucomicrobia bacterium]|nr:SDR family NAD(P)-dependent oxidoreductase [Verrucomicrobiota bacterium]MBV9276401.1 SDR family NAD(P)-dependent oxidoreductase [Verrucomicrobiota bacterium]
MTTLKFRAYVLGMSTSYFAGCTALITGASAGIGREFARQLAPVVGSLILVARRVERLEALELELKVINPELEIFVRALDLRDENELPRFCDWLEESGLVVDLLINNAGLGDRGEFAHSDWDRVQAMLKVNISALTYLTYRILPSMQKSGCGAVLNVSSVVGFLPIPTAAVYAATKAYVTSFTEAIRAELRRSNISVTALCPGPVATEFNQVAIRSPDEINTPPDVVTVPVQEVVRQALIGIAHDRPRVIPGLALRTLMTVIIFVPMFLKRLIFDIQLRRQAGSPASVRSNAGNNVPSRI